MFPSWLVIGGVTLLMLVLIRPSPQGYRWFMRLRRPRWLTFEWAIPLIWTTIFIFGAWSAVLVWNASRPIWLMVWYLLLEITILAYTPVMCHFRSLRIGTLIGGLGFILGCLLTIQVFPISSTAGWLLVPFLLWSPIGTFVTWQMAQLNPADS